MAEQLIMDWTSMLPDAGPYPRGAYEFVREGLGYTADLVHAGEPGDTLPAHADEGRHVTGQQLCFGLKDYAIKQYGLLARTVLAHWSITRTEDFGAIIYAMVEAELMRTTEHDSIDDFSGVYDFDDAFGTLAPIETAG